MFLLKKIIAALMLPPAGPILLALFGLWLSRRNSRRWQYGGIVLAATALLALLVLSMPIAGHALMAPLQPHPPIAPAQLKAAQAIVILGGGSYYGAPEYGGDTIGGATLERVRYGARLARESSLPLLAAARVTRIALVSHVWHLPRAIPLFEQQGFQVIAAPTGFSAASPAPLENFLPTGSTGSRWAINEYLGRLFYRLKKWN